METRKTALTTAHVIGFFSLPHPSLAEHNPSAYSAAMAGAPAGAGACSQCGMGIRHHVVIRDESGTERFIGTDCAERVGVAPESLRYRLTSDQLAERDARRKADHAEWQRKQQERENADAVRLAARMDAVGDLVDMLRRLGGEFYSSMAEQLSRGPLSSRQAEYVAKATSSTGRRNKRNADAFDAVFERCIS
jgi:hypothetical protein